MFLPEAAAAPQTGISLRGARGNPRAIGARVTFVLPSGATQIRDLSAGGGYLSQEPPVVFVPATVRRIKVRWPDGKESTHAIKGARITVEQSGP